MSKKHHIHHDFHEDFHLRESLDYEDDEEEGFWDEKKKKILIKIMSVFIILLMISFLLPLQRIGSIVESKKIDENFIIQLKNDKRIVFDKTVYEAVRDKYISSSTEIKVCLIGSKTGNTYIVDDYYSPRIVSSQYDRVVSESCNSRTLISMHSHPNTWCIFSGQDIRTYEKIKESNSKAFIGLICDVDKFNFYGY